MNLYKHSAESLIYDISCLANFALVLETAMFDSDFGAANCEEAMRLFTERLNIFSSELKEALQPPSA